ncbi:MAG: hypothetical protein ACFFAJ_08005 [Candidatus Hodarchaeota archaeon]
MVKLFKRKSDKETREFKFETSLKLKDLPIEEYAHIAHAFQVAALRFERMLKESLLEGYITSSTLERITREFNFAEIRDTEIPETPSVNQLFGSETPLTKAIERIPEPTTPKPTIETVKVPEPQPIKLTAPTTLPITPSQPQTQPSVEKAVPPTETVTSPPKFSFSFPETPSISQPSSTTPKAPEKEPTTPSIPKISFPSVAKPPKAPTLSPLASITKRREEDRATGIAILRKQMLTELKKIRSVVSEQER